MGKRKQLTDEQLEFIKEKVASGIGYKKVVEAYKERFDDSISTTFFHCNKAALGLVELNPNKLNIFTKEIEDFLVENHKLYSRKELTKIVNEKFGTNYVYSQLQNYLQKHKLYSDNDGKFKKGDSRNKGRKWDDFLTKEQQKRISQNLFKNGFTPWHKGKIGDTHFNKKGNNTYRYTLTEDGWKPNARHVYEQYHHVKLKTNDRVIHIDGDTLNDNIDNLILCSGGEVLRFNKQFKKTNDKELNLSKILTTKIQCEVIKSEKNNRRTKKVHSGECSENDRQSN